MDCVVIALVIDGHLTINSIAAVFGESPIPVVDHG